MNYRLVFTSTVLLASCLFLGCGEKPAEKPVRPVKAIKVGDVTDFTGRTFPGRAEATEEVNLGFEVDGTLTERPVNKGDEVKKGQLLARLDPRDFKNELAATEAERERAKAHRDRIAEAAKTGAVAKQDLTDAQAKLDQAEAVVKIKQKALDDSQIFAPFDGVVAATYAENFQRVRAREKVLRLLDLSKIKFDIDIPESLISDVPYVKEAWVEYDAFPDRKVPAKIKEVGTEASRTTRTYPVTLIMDQPGDFKILPGMAGKAGGKGKLPENAGETGLEVPISAVFTSGEAGKSYVWVIDENTMTVKRQEVTPVRLTPTGMLVKGVKPGEWITTAGVHHLQDGQRVRLPSNPSKEPAK